MLTRSRSVHQRNTNAHGPETGAMPSPSVSVRMIARRGYGFHSRKALISMLFLCKGGIELNPPLPTR